MEIPLTRGRVAIVDECDFERVSQFKWFCTDTGRAARQVRVAVGKQQTQYMARFILDAPDGVEVDHANRDRLDNRRGNLRMATRAQNTSNRSAFSNSKSGIKGVMWYQRYKKWTAQIRTNGIKKTLGYFERIADAATAYEAAAIAAQGEFARPTIREFAQ